MKNRRLQKLESPVTLQRNKSFSGIAFRVEMKQTVYLRCVTELTEIEIQAMFYSINLDGKIFTLRQVVYNRTDFFEIYRHWHNFHDPFSETS
jgi:hypothetical protein